MGLVNVTSRLAMILAVTLVVGCGKTSVTTGPKTVPVRGKITFTRGGEAKSLANREGRIEFQSVEQPTVHAIGAIEEDGSFTVSTITGEGGSEGALPGTHRVRLELDDQSQNLVAPQFLTFERSGITVDLPSEQPLEVKVWR